MENSEGECGSTNRGSGSPASNLGFPGGNFIMTPSQGLVFPLLLTFRFCRGKNTDEVGEQVKLNRPTWWDRIG